jgi:cytochrome c553
VKNVKTLPPRRQERQENLFLSLWKVLASLASWRLIAFAPFFAASSALADGGENLAPSAANPKWKSECGACHVAYPPALLPERSWRKLMSGLERHFGDDASLDPASVKEITDFLARNSAEHSSRSAKILRGIAPADAPLRITETPWFQRKHDEIRADVWKRPKVGSAANCAACHTGAEKGDYDEDRVRIPR